VATDKATAEMCLRPTLTALEAQDKVAAQKHGKLHIGNRERNGILSPRGQKRLSPENYFCGMAVLN